MSGVIYGWKNKETGIIKYVWKTKHVYKRKSSHKLMRGRSTALYNAFRKYGVDAFEFVIIQKDIETDEELRQAEGYWARHYKTLSSMGFGGYNITDPLGDKNYYSKSWLENLTAGQRKRFERKDQIQWLSDLSRKNASDPEFRKKVGEAARKRSSSKEHIEKMKSVYASELWRSKNKAASEKNKKPVLCIETGVVYAGACDVQSILGINNAHVTAVCKGRENKAGGFHWEYYQP